MSIIKQNLHDELKTALRLSGVSLKRFANSLLKPDGKRGITHTALIRVAQNHENTPWIRSVIENTIRQSKSQFPEYWKKIENS